ncbi:isoflavone reductase family protein [Penicillium verhagenii]|nr:isoflavone reductase family protein [Penicillium verhagenii]
MNVPDESLDARAPGCYQLNAGAFAAVVVDFIVYPVDTLKTRIQSPNYERVYKDARTGAVKRNVLFRGLYQGVWSVVFSTIPSYSNFDLGRNDEVFIPICKFGALFIVHLLMPICFSAGAFFTTYEAVKYAFYNSSTNARQESEHQRSRSKLRLPFDHSLPTPIIHAIASSSAEMVSCLLLTPAEVLKQNAQMINSPQTQSGSTPKDASTNKNYKTNKSAMRQVLSRFKSHPWRLWSGYTALVGRNLPFTGLQFPMFEFIRTHVTDWRESRKQEGRYSLGEDSSALHSSSSSSSAQRAALIERAGVTAFSAGVAGTISSFVTTPIDVVKTRVMLSAADDIARTEGDTSRVQSKGSKKGTWVVGKETFRKEGVRGLFKGGAIRSVWTAVSMSLYLSLYEGGKNVFGEPSSGDGGCWNRKKRRRWRCGYLDIEKSINANMALETTSLNKSETMTKSFKNVMLMGAGGLFGTEVLSALQKEGTFNLSILSRKSSSSTFPADIKVHKIDDDYPIDQLTTAFKGQDALVSTLPGRPYTVHLRMIDAAIQAGVKRFIPTEYGNNTCAAAAKLVTLYAEKAKVIAYLKTQEHTGLTWTAIHTGQFFDWGLEAGWLDYHLKERKVTIYDSGDKAWSTSTLGTASAAVVKVLLKPEQTENKPVFVASFTVSQRQVLEELEKATGEKWEVRRMSSADALKKAAELDTKDYSDGLKLLVLMLLYADDMDRGADFAKDGLLWNDLLGLREENLAEVVGRVVKQQAP